MLLSYGELLSCFLSRAGAVATIQQALDAIAAAFPETPLTQQGSVKYVRKRQSTKPELIAKAVTTAQTAPALQSFIDVADARDTLAFNDAFRPVYERMNAIAQELKFAIQVRHAKSSAEARTVYVTAKRIAEQGPGGADLVAHVDDMKSVARRGGKSKRTKVTTEPPAATTASPTATVPPTAKS